jgi:hypothetical protein
LVIRRRPAENVQCPIALPIRIAPTIFRKLDDSLGGFFNGRVGSFHPKDCARHFERDAK